MPTLPRRPLVVVMSTIVLLSASALAHEDAHGPAGLDPNTPVAAESADTRNTTHVDIDVVPTLAEEAELLRRVESEGLGVNPLSGIQLRASGNVAQVGRWEPLQNWPVIGVFASLLPDGRVLTYDSVGDNPTESYSSHTFTRASVWDPDSNTHTRIDSDTGYNVFCSGFATLPDGRLFIAGGNADAALNGIVETHTFNPISDTWTRGQRMDFTRWYPSVTPLSDGEMLITGGGRPISEVRRTDGSIRQLTSASSSVWNNREYPWLQTAPDGRVAFLGPNRQLGYVNTAGSGSFQTTIQRENTSRNYGSYAMYDIGKVLVAGGGYQSASVDQRRSTVIDLDTDTVSVSGSMNNRRRQHNLTVLADGSVLATGGFASNAGLVDLNNAVYEAERWDPNTGQWQRLADEARARQYHSTALLLPDGRVLSAGGGICGACQANGYIQKNGQVFTPPYLFRQDGSGALATRPSISTTRSELGYDEGFDITTSQAASIDKVALVRVGAVTHSQNMEQRYVPLDFTLNGGVLRARSPLNANIAPPGYYMLFIVDQAGVPSVARMVSVQTSFDVPPPQASVYNAALGASASQSSTASNAVASLAIDGNTDGNAANGSVARTTSSEQPWWQVDLGQVEDIRQVVVNRRSDCCSGRLSNFHLIASSTPFDTTTLADTLAQSGVSDYYTRGTSSLTRIDVERPARYLRIQLAGQTSLELAEVQVLVEGAGQGFACGDPGIDPASDAGVHVWKACGGPWTLMLTGENNAGSINAAGRIASELGFQSVVPRTIESSDALGTSDPSKITFDLTTGNPWTDHFEFSAPSNDNLCLALDRITGNQQLYIGAYRVPAGSGPIDPRTLQSCEFGGVDCTAPVFDSTSDKALVSWVDCAGVLHLVAMGGQDFARYSGHVYSTSRFTDSDTRSFESSDTLVSVSDSDVFFDMGVGGGYTDEILLTPAATDGLCIELTAQSGGTQLLAGANRTPVSSPFDPLTFEPCDPPSGNNDCGDPQVDNANDSALFVWKRCDGTWSVRLTGTDSGGGTVEAVGSINASAGFSSITPVGLEGSDSLTTALGSDIAFDMRTVNPWSDGFDFTVPDGSQLCVSLSSALDGIEILAGPDRTPVGTSFDPQTYASCS